jgi:hypothetical protein
MPPLPFGNSFDALMSLDLQSLQSMDNLANLILNGGNPSFTNLPQAGLKNADFSQPPSQQQQSQQHQFWNNNNGSTSGGGGGGADNDSSGWMQRLSSSNRIQSLFRTLSSNMNMNQQPSVAAAADAQSHSPSNANFANLLQSVQAASQQQQQQPQQQQSHNNNNNNNSHNIPYTATSSAVSLANLLRQDSYTGLSALRVQDGLNHRNKSVDDFLSLMAVGEFATTGYRCSGVIIFIGRRSSPVVVFDCHDGYDRRHFVQCD